VDVLEDDDGGLVQLGEERPSHCPRVELRGHRVGEPSVRRSGEVHERPERDRRREALARPVEHRRGDARREGPHECRLADPGLAADEHQPASRGERRGERGEALVALEELGHDLMFRPLEREFKALRRSALCWGRSRCTMSV